MGLREFIDNFFDEDNKIRKLSSHAFGRAGDSGYGQFVVDISIALIAKTVARADYQTYLKGVEHNGTNHYIFNVEANMNKSATLFWRELITKLLKKGEALVLVQEGQLFLMDSFERKEFAFKENIYSNIVVGDFQLHESKLESEILYFKYDISSINKASESIYNDFQKLIESSIKGYENSKARKGILDIPANLPTELDSDEALQKYIAASMSDFMNPSKDAIYPASNGFKYTEISESKGSKSNDSGREARNFINDVFDFIAIAFGIPPNLLKGDTVDTKDAVNTFLTFCINPFAEMIQDEINRKMYGKEEYLANSFLKVDTTNIKAVDMRDIANSIDLLNRNGAMTIDDILRTLGKEAIGGEVGTMRFVTKNLDLIDNVLQNGKTGNNETNENNNGGD